MPTWLASLIADINALVAAWSSVRGGWQAAWRDAAQLLAHRRVLVDTLAQTSEGTQVVLRTRVRLNGDVQTDILRCWLNRTSHQSVGELVERHFQSVVDATRGWSAARGGIRLGTQLIIALGMVAGIASAIPPALQAEWELLVPALLTNWRVLSGISITAFGFLLRWALRLWLRWKFQGSLSMG